ncbi:TrmH family RNA methyltransferase [Meiothermus granaticius]|uniref:tRNA (guanosine(18)-2'-O)-methyltransferase n=1 Tax=Meiothermus granaticius NBRC 107808 TaxID=1227551 RepID=A0A399F5R8_9DEIN|nr:TrmH family RNA methyltransferase [Meiothermus granaticius]RIH91423.1 tRNA (guanosine(18)-2'-O)-methyltransferase [Meiothermus granaticius NBRC 107808]GEM87094.1 tRNA (guanosine(18)-2'-O)-methyltransferase [Meiothermus granaticius NBRC 107808]
MTPERLQRLRTVLDRRQPDLTVLLEQVHKPHNFSAILRTCDAVGVLEAHAVLPSKGLPPLPEAEGEAAGSLLSAIGSGKTYSESSGSAAKWMFLQAHPDTASAFKHLRARGFQIYAAHLSETAVDYRTVDYTAPTCVLLGAEKWGVSAEAAEGADAHVAIPMLGMVQSLNVSVAAAVILFEAQRQRLQAGLYDQPRLSPERYQAILETWSQAKR